MFGKKRKIKALIAEASYEVIHTALTEISEIEVLNEGKPDYEMTVNAIRQKALIALKFVRSFNDEAETIPEKRASANERYVYTKR